MYTTACEACRKVRAKCIRPSRGYDQNETCERCQLNKMECSTVKRRVGRQAGVKNKKRRLSSSIDDHSFTSSTTSGSRDANHLPNPLHVLASEASRQHMTPEADDNLDIVDSLMGRTSATILDKFAAWTNKIHPKLGREALDQRLGYLLADKPGMAPYDGDEPSEFSGRMDMARPDGAPEHDVITLQIISLADAQYLFDSFMRLVRNGSMNFDPRLHTLPYIRSRSSFLLAVILSVATTFKTICSSARLHSRLVAHAQKLGDHVRNNHLKSIEIVQALFLLASWTEIPSTLCRDKTWLYVSHAIAIVTELRLDAPVPYCIQMDAEYGKSPAMDEILIRNAHRTCLMMYIHDRDMAMISGRYPIYPESSVTAQKNLDQWGKVPRAQPIDAPITASVSLRKTVIELHHRMAAETSNDFAVLKGIIDKAMADWAGKWATQIKSSAEYTIIAKFSSFVLHVTLMRKKQFDKDMKAQAKEACEELAFEVVCGAIAHYKTWQSLLNSATFDTCMVAFCAIYIVQSIKQTPSSHLSDWSVFRLAALQELVHELEKQGEARHRLDAPETRNVIEAMAKQIAGGIRLILSKKTASTPAFLSASLDTASNVSDNIGPAHAPDLIHHETDLWFSLHADAQLPQQPQLASALGTTPTTGVGVPDTTSPFSEMDPFGLCKNPMPFFPEWNMSMWGGTSAPTLDPGASGSGLDFPWDMHVPYGASGEGAGADDQNPLAMFGFN